MAGEKPTKRLRCIQRSIDPHWVGDGFPVRTLFAYPNLGPVIDPFLLLDYAGPVEFPPTTERLGVGEHPHRGFETVTIVYAGEVEHRLDAAGAATALLLAGEPIREPIVGQGPFVMNRPEEIRQALLDYQGGGMGRLS